MKIDHTGIITVPSGYAMEMQTHAHQAGTEFAHVLNQAMHTSQTADHTANPLSMLEPVQTVPFGIATDIDESVVIEQIEGLLNSLDAYRERLRNHFYSAAEIQPLINDMSRKARYLSVTADAIQNEDLKGIINQTLVTTSLEEVKYYRGDYNT